MTAAPIKITARAAQIGTQNAGWTAAVAILSAFETFGRTQQTGTENIYLGQPRNQASPLRCAIMQEQRDALITGWPLR